MGLLGFIKKNLNDFDSSQKIKRREISGCDRRLKYFIEKHPGEVINGYIPITCHWIGEDFSNTGNAVEYYLRLEYFDGRTRFEWFDNFSDGSIYKIKIIEGGEYAKVIGPSSIYGAFY